MPQKKEEKNLSFLVVVHVNSVLCGDSTDNIEIKDYTK